MITNWFITGDTHRHFGRFNNYSFAQDYNSAVIILGDATFNWMLNEEDDALKQAISNKYKMMIYCVRGNHEARPQDIEGMELIFDGNVKGDVWYQPEYPNIRYFKDWGIYTINGLKTAVIGGAYSVDKWYRLGRHAIWFPNEQLTPDEMTQCAKELSGAEFDLVLTHTCPLSWEPIDLFLGGIDQSKVDKSTEIFLENIKKQIRFRVWLFGHYHADRLERPGVEQFYRDTENLDTVWQRWLNYDPKVAMSLDWWLSKSPNFYMEN